MIQNDIGNQRAPTTIIAAISTAVRLYPINVKIEPSETGLRSSSIVKTSQILTVDKSRLEKRLGRLSEAKLKDVAAAIKPSLDIE